SNRDRLSRLDGRGWWFPPRLLRRQRERDQPQQEPRRRVLEEVVVEERVDEDGGHRQPRRERNETARPEDVLRHPDEEPDEEREPEKAGLGRNSDRRVVGRRRLQVLLSVEPLHAPSVRMLEAADADSAHRMGDRDTDSVRDEVVPAAGGTVQPTLRVVLERSPHGRLRDREAAEDDHRQPDGEEGLPAPRDERDGDDRDDERGEARLRERDEEAEPDDEQRRGGRTGDAQRAAAGDEDDARDHRHDEEPPVDRRVPENRID